jgi:ADP-heptose:LPS heptosyltransferase
MADIRRLDELLDRQPQRIVVLQALMLDNFLCAIPALRALRAAYADAEITLVGLPWAREVVHRFRNYLSGFVEFPGFPGIPESPVAVDRIPGFLAEIQRRRYDVALQVQGSQSLINCLVMLFGARITAGYYLAEDHCPDARTFLISPEHEPEIWRHLRLMQHLGIPLRGDTLEFPVTEEDRHELYHLVDNQLSADNYVCIHPGARFWSRRWKPERFAEVGDALARNGYQVVITGAASETEMAQSVSHAMKASHLNLSGCTTLGGLAALLAGSRLLISNDTSVSHIAAALRLPSVIVVTGSNPDRWAPLDRERHRLAYRPIDCRPCVHALCPIGFPCAEELTVQQVVDCAFEVLGRFGEDDRAAREAAYSGAK